MVHAIRMRIVTKLISRLSIMLRKRLQEAVRTIAQEAESKTYEYWVQQVYPIQYDDVVDGESVSVDIEVLEKNPEYIQLGICVNHYSDRKTVIGVPIYTPNCYSVVIKRA